MDEEVTLTGSEAGLASRITSIDRDLDALEQRTRDSVVRGLHSSGAAMRTNAAQAQAEQQRADLLAERADLVDRLKTEVARNAEVGADTAG